MKKLPSSLTPQILMRLRIQDKLSKRRDHGLKPRRFSWTLINVFSSHFRCREDMELGVVYLKLSGLGRSSSPESPPTRSHDIDGSPSSTGAVSLQANKLPIPAAFSRVTPRPNETTLLLNQSLSNSKLVSNGSSTIPTARQSPLNPLVIPLTGSRPVAPPNDRKTSASFLPSIASISPLEIEFRPSLITRRSYDTSLPAAPKEEPSTTIVSVGDEGITLATTVAGHPMPTKQPVSAGLIPQFLRSKGPQPAPSLAPLSAGIAGSSVSAMELFQGLPSADTILFATLTTRPKTKEASEVDVSDGKPVIEFQNTPEAAQAMLHLSLKKTLSVGVLLDALISLGEEETSKGGKFKRRLGRLGRQVHSIR